MRFNVEQVILFSLALLILFMVAGSLLLSPLAWVEAAAREIAQVFEPTPATPIVTTVPSFKGKTLADDLKFSPDPPNLRYEAVPPALLEAFTSPAAPNAQLDSMIKNHTRLTPGQELHFAKFLERLNADQDLSSQEWTELVQCNASQQDFLRDISTLANASSFSKGMTVFRQDTENTKILQQGVQTLCLESFRLARDMEPSKALAAVASAAKLAQASSIARMETQKAQTEAMDTAINSWAQILDKQSDPGLMETSLRQMNALAASQQEALEQVPEPISRDLLSRLHTMSPGEIGTQIERIAPDYLLEKYAAQKQKVLEKMAAISPNDPRIESTRKQFEEEITSLSEQVGQALERRKQAETDTSPTLALDQQTAAEEVVQAKLDLLRIKTVNIIASKTDNTVQEDIERLVPRFLPFEPKDPFSLENYRIDAESRLVYSIGPDGKDNGANLVYDPTNGTVSAGDVIIASPSFVESQ